MKIEQNTDQNYIAFAEHILQGGNSIINDNESTWHILSYMDIDRWWYWTVN